MDFLPNSFPGNPWAVRFCSMLPLQFKVPNLATRNYWFFCILNGGKNLCRLQRGRWLRQLSSASWSLLTILCLPFQKLCLPPTCSPLQTPGSWQGSIRSSGRQQKSLSETTVYHTRAEEILHALSSHLTCFLEESLTNPHISAKRVVKRGLQEKKCGSQERRHHD